MRGWLLAVIAVLGALVGAVPAAAAVGTPVATCILRAAPGMSARALFAAPGRFDCRTPQTRYGAGDFWVLSAPVPRGAPATHGPTIVRTASVWQRAVDLHVLYGDGAIRTVRYTSATTGERLRLGAAIASTIPRRGAAPVRLLWHVRGAGNLRGVVLGASLADQDQDTHAELLLAVAYGAFAGMAAALMIYNLALWAALRQPFQPAYCALLLCLGCYAASSSGALGQWLPLMDNNDRLRLNALFLGGSAAAAVVFARTFFEPRVFAGGLRRASVAVIAALLGSGTLYAVAAPWHIAALDRVIVAAFLMLLGFVAALLWQAWRVRSNYLWLFAVAWGAPIIFAGLRVANALALLPWSFWLDNSTITSMTLEALVSALGIAYRIHLLSRERDEARTQEVAARLLADTDPLTGLPNRRAFLDRAIGRAGEQILLLADVDHFKRVNETIGHDGGDEVLRVFARVLRAAVPAHALVARLGGEEFAIVAPAGSGVSAAGVLERLRAERMPFDLAVTASIGSCTGALANEADWKALYRCADGALFEAKAAGRDRARTVRLAA